MNKFLIFSFLLVFTAACRTQEPPVPGDTVKNFVLEPGDTLGESLAVAELPDDARAELINSFSRVFDPRRCRAGDRYEIRFDTSSRWTGFRYYTPGLDFYTVERSTDGRAVAAKRTLSIRREMASAKGTITTSLWESMTASGLSPALIIDFADIFAWQIDFLTEPRKGDTYKLLWENSVTEDGRVIQGEILGAQYIASGQTYTALLFTRPNGRKDYYTPEGKSLRSAFLKAPLQFRRISSHFTARRYHPVLKYFRPHLGIDYAAPTGTPVSSIGDGTVLFAGRRGGFGKFVKIRHANGYESSYGHLSRYGKGIRAGMRVRQGQVIGYVGSTGLSTGPHLDFRISKNGRFINFLTIKMPAAATVLASEKEGFRDMKKTLFTRLAEIR